MSNQLTSHLVDSWRTLHLQLIVFPENPKECLQHDWLADLSGAEVESNRKKLERVDSGEVNGHAVSVSIDPLRVVWTAAPRVDLEEMATDPPSALPSVGPFPAARDWFTTLMDRWLPSCPAINRISFAAKLLQQTNTREESYGLLGLYLHNRVQVDPSNSSEFLYRINRQLRTSSQIDNLAINRLGTWSSLKMQVQLRAGIVGSSIQKDIPLEFSGCSLDLDINTSQDRKDVLPSDRLSAIWHELAFLGTEIATDGDAC